MSTQIDQYSEQLNQVCRASGSRWAVWLFYGEGEWRIVAGARLSKARHAGLLNFIQEPKTTAWLAGSLHTGRTRTRDVGEYKEILACQRVFSFVSLKSEWVLLVGADGLSAEKQNFIKILSHNNPQILSPSRSPDAGASQDSISNNEIFNVRQQLLIDLAHSISHSWNAEDAVQLAIDRLRSIYKTDQAAVLLISADRKRLREIARPRGAYPLVVPVQGSLAGIIIQTTEPLRNGNIQRDAQLSKGENPQTCSVLAVPLKNRNQVIGVLIIESNLPDYFTVSDEAFLQVIASQISGVMVNIDVYREARLRARNLDLIHQVVQHIVGMTDEAKIAQRTAELMAEYFGFEFAEILVPDLTGKYLKTVGIGGSQAYIYPLGFLIPMDKSISGRVYRSGESLFSNEVRNDPDYFTLGDWEAGAEICVPLREGDNIIGVINLERSRNSVFTEADQILVESLAGILSSVMIGARRYSELEDRLNKFRAIRETNLAINENLDIDILLQQVVHQVRMLVQAKGAEIGLVDDEHQGIRVQTSETPWYNFSGHLIPPGEGIAGHILVTKSPVRVADYNAWPERLILGKPADFKAAAGVPLMFKDQVLGTLVVMDDHPEREFSDDDIATLELVAKNISMAIHTAQLIRDLQESIEAQRQAENRLIQSERMAVAGRLTASIAHEINNPLQAVHNCLYLAQRSELSASERQKYLTMAGSELDRLISTVQRMLDFYRPGARDRQHTDINQMIEHLVALVEPQMTKNQISIITELAGDLPVVLAVPSQIQQVLLNLVVNAMQAMPNGGKIYIQTRANEAFIPTRRKIRKHSIPVGVEILVRDTGPGVPVGERERIFEPFVSTKDNGIGLGLSVSYGIIQAHGGMLSLVTDEQVGACFRIVLPEEKST
jgi:signal transduction histidine kinase